jgi:hypothetical protein
MRQVASPLGIGFSASKRRASFGHEPHLSPGLVTLIINGGEMRETPLNLASPSFVELKKKNTAAILSAAVFFLSFL